MNANGNLDDEDLALFAMHLLEEPEATAVARSLEKSEDTRQRLAEIRATLAVYAEATTELQEVPEGSLDRLLVRIAAKKNVAPSAVSHVAAPARLRAGFTGKVLPWVGWAVAAGVIVIAGKLHQDRKELYRALNTRTAQVAHVSADGIDVYRERDTLKTTLSKQSEELAALRTEVGNEKREAQSLQTTIDNQTAELNEQKAKVANQAAFAENAARDGERLQQTISAQANELAGLRAEEKKAQQVLEALTDRTAFRVTLTKPKTRVAPSGRAIYLPSRGTLVFLASNLAPLSSNKVYQLWLMPADQSKPVPAGTFLPDASGNASIVNTNSPVALPARGFSVTIEKEGGAQTPTLPIILAGE